MLKQGEQLTVEQLPDIMDAEIARKYLSLGRSTMYILLKRGSIPAVRVGTQWRLSKRALLAWLEEQMILPDNTSAQIAVKAFMGYDEDD